MCSAECPCTGNQGFYNSHGSHRVDGIMRPGYEYPPNLGSFCSDKHEGALGGGWCYVSCDTSVCKNVTRHFSSTMWAGKLFGIELCYSYDNCGHADQPPALKQVPCKERGGHSINGKCSCDTGGLCNDNSDKQESDNNKDAVRTYPPVVAVVIGF